MPKLTIRSRDIVVLIFSMILTSTVAVRTATAADSSCAEDDTECWIKTLKANDEKEAMQAAMALGRLQSAEASGHVRSTKTSKGGRK